MNKSFKRFTTIVINWFKKLFKSEPHDCLFREADVWFYDDPQCQICGKKASVVAKEKGLQFTKKSPKRSYEGLINKI